MPLLWLYSWDIYTFYLTFHKCVPCIAMYSLPATLQFHFFFVRMQFEVVNVVSIHPKLTEYQYLRQTGSRRPCHNTLQIQHICISKICDSWKKTVPKKRTNRRARIIPVQNRRKTQSCLHTIISAVVWYMTLYERIPFVQCACVFA